MLAQKKRTESLNFQTALISLIIYVFTYNGIDVDPVFLSDLFANLDEGHWAALLIATPQVLTITMKLTGKIKAKAFDWTFLKGKNFLTQAGSTLAAGLVLAGVINLDIGVSIVAILHSINTGYHFVEG